MAFQVRIQSLVSMLPEASESLLVSVGDLSRYQNIGSNGYCFDSFFMYGSSFTYTTMCSSW